MRAQVGHAPAAVQPPLHEENWLNAGAVPSVTTWPRVAWSASVADGCSAATPPYTWHEVVSQIWKCAARGWARSYAA